MYAYLKFTNKGRAVWIRHDAILAIEVADDGSYLTTAGTHLLFIDQSAETVIASLSEALEYGDV